MSFQILKGQFLIENLLLNTEQINRDLDAKKIPFHLKFGVLKKFRLKLSILSQQLENLEVDSFIIILGPNPNLNLDKKMTGSEEDLIYMTCLNNMENQVAKNYLDYNKIFGDEIKKYEKEVQN